MRTKSIILFLLFIFSFFLFPSVSAQTFLRTYGGTKSETGTCIQHTQDGNYIISGIAASFTNGYNDAYLVKVNPQGTLLWSKTYGGTNDEHGYYVNTCADGGFILTGSTSSFGSGGMDLFLIKTDSDGNHQWSTAIGGTADDYGWYVMQTKDGGYVATGTTNSFGGGGYDGYLVKVNSAGTLLWSKTFGGTGNEALNGMSKTKDGGFIVAGEVSTNSFGSSDLWLLKFNANGDTMWTKQWGKPTEDAANAVFQTADGGYIVAGDSHTFVNLGAHRAVITKTDSLGNLKWYHQFGSYPGAEIAYDVLPDSGNGYYLLCYTGFYGNGNQDYLVIHTDSVGKKTWAKTYGGSGNEDPWYFQQTTDGGLMVVGATTSFGVGQFDVFLVNTDSAGATSCYENNVSPYDTIPVFQIKSGTTITSAGIVSPMIPTVTIANSQTTDPCAFLAVDKINNVDMSVSVFPNPFSESTTIKINGQLKIHNGEFSMYDVFGREVKKVSFANYSFTIQRGDLSAGIYFYQLSTSSLGKGRGEVIATGKLVVE